MKRKMKLNKMSPEKSKQYLKNTILAIQHVFAMIGATVLVPMLTNLSIAMTLLSAGIGTLIFYVVTKRKVPVFLGSSFAFVGPLIICMKPGEIGFGTEEWLQAYGKVSVGLMFAALVYVGMAILVRMVGVEKVKKLFPPVVIGPVIMVIGLNLAPVVFENNIAGTIEANPTNGGKVWAVVCITTLVILFISAFMKKGFFNTTAVLCGIIVGYLSALGMGLVKFDPVKEADWVIFQKDSLKLFGFYKYIQFDAKTVLLFAPTALVTCMEHIGDISANSAITSQNFLVDPGLNRTLLGDGLATCAAGFLGGPANTTYGENTAVLSITKNYNPNVIALAAVFAIIMGVFGKIGGVIATIPQPVIGGASLILFGMIASSGLKVMIDEKLDFSQPRNLFVASIILVVGVGMNAAKMTWEIGDKGMEISPLAIVTVLGVVLNIMFVIREKIIGVEAIYTEEEKESFFEYQD